jgi:uncharacterized phage protein gp47/JayE
MTFFAPPYEQIVDDLLTAVTGGVVREEHCFLGGGEFYALSSPGAIPGSLKVLGQRNEAFQVFELGIDYDYQQENEGICWKPDGKLPDERSFFYVNYYLNDGRRLLTDRNPGSVAATLCEAFGREFAVSYKQMELIYKSAFLDFATGISLDNIAALLGLERKDAKFASGEVLFKRGTPAPADITISTATLVSTKRGFNFETTNKRILRRGQLAITAPIRAQTEGLAGRVNARDIAIINRPIFGIETVINESATFFAMEKEADDELRRRVKATLERAGKATVDAIKYNLIEDIPEITENNIQVAEKLDVPGLVEVRLGLESTGDADLVRRVEESIFYARPAGVRVTHNLPTLTKPLNGEHAQGKGIPREKAVADFKAIGEPPGVTPISDAELAGMAQGVLSLQAEVFLRLTEQNLTATQKEAAEDQARNSILEYIENLPMGEPVIYSKLLGRVVQPDTIADATLLIGTESTGTFRGYKGSLSTMGRKATIDLYHIFVGLMAEAVFVDVAVRLQPNPAEGSSPPSQVSEELNKAAIAAIGTHVATAKGRLLKNELESEIRTILKTSGLQLIERNPLTVNAEYEETGRLLSDTNEILLAEHEEATLRNMSLKIVGPLDV